MISLNGRKAVHSNNKALARENSRGRSPKTIEITIIDGEMPLEATLGINTTTHRYCLQEWPQFQGKKRSLIPSLIS